jgi:hypothetical protein
VGAASRQPDQPVPSHHNGTHRVDHPVVFLWFKICFLADQDLSYLNSVTCSLCLQRTSTSACQSIGWTLCGFISTSYYGCPGNSIRASACIGTAH